MVAPMNIGLRYIFVALLLLGILSKATIAYQRSVNSDEAEAAVIYYDLIENGNYHFQDWYFVTNSHLLTEFPLYFLLGKIFGMGMLTTKLGAFLIYMGSMGALFLVVRRTFGLNTALCAITAIATAALGTHILFLSYMHTDAIAYGLAAVYLVLVLADTAVLHRSVLLIVALFVLSLAASFSNPFYIFSCSLPICISLAILLVSRRSLLGAPRDIAVSLLLLAAGVLGVLAQGWVQSWGPHISRLPSDSASLAMVASNAVKYLGAVAYLQGIEFGRDASWIERALISPLRTVLLIAPLAMLGTLRWRDMSRTQWFVLLFLVCACSVLSGAFLTKALVANRYLTPLLYAWATFLALAIVGNRDRRPRLAIFLLVSFTMVSIFHVRGGFAFSQRQDMAEEAKLLRGEGLSYGYASYWNSNLLTLLTENEVRVRPLEFSDFRLEPFLWESNSRWYAPSVHEGQTFLLVKKGEEYQGFNHLNRSLLEQMIGPVERVLKTENAVIYVWPYNIMKALLPFDAVSPGEEREVGSILQVGGGYVAEARPGETGVILRGKARHLSPGNYRARFTLVATGSPAGAPAARIGVYRIDAGSIREIASRDIAAGLEGKWREELLDFSIPLDKSLTARFEFRVSSTGRARVMVSRVTREPLP